MCSTCSFPPPTLSQGNVDPVTVSIVLPLAGCCGWKRSPHKLSSDVAMLLAILLAVTKESFRGPTPLSAFGSVIMVSACFKCSSLEIGCGSSFLGLFFHVVLLLMRLFRSVLLSFDLVVHSLTEF